MPDSEAKVECKAPLWYKMRQEPKLQCHCAMQKSHKHAESHHQDPAGRTTMLRRLTKSCAYKTVYQAGCTRRWRWRRRLAGLEGSSPQPQDALGCPPGVSPKLSAKHIRRPCNLNADMQEVSVKSLEIAQCKKVLQSSGWSGYRNYHVQASSKEPSRLCYSSGLQPTAVDVACQQTYVGLD